MLAALSPDLLEKMDDIVWSINPRNDNLEDLMVRLKRFAAALFEAKNKFRLENFFFIFPPKTTIG